jgi:hypothetical protein
MIDSYSLEEVKNSDMFLLSSDLSEEELDNFRYMKSEVSLVIEPPNYLEYNEVISQKEYFIQVLAIINALRKYNKKAKILIDFISRKDLNESGILDEEGNGITLIIGDDGYQYNVEEYIEEEKKLNELVESIKNSNMSPLEKFLAVYNKVTHYMPYKGDGTNGDKSRRIRYILNGDLIVCTGFSRLLCNLLDKVGIKAMPYDFELDGESKKNEIRSEVIKEQKGHSRVLVNLVDPKYSIDGYYVSDPTWDNSVSRDYYSFALYPYSDTDKEHRLFYLNIYDYLLGSKDAVDFNRRINAYLNSNTDNGYQELFYKIMSILNILDEDKYVELYSKYGNGFGLSSKEYDSFINEYANYILIKSNNEIPPQTLFSGILQSKKNTSNLNISELRDWCTQVLEDYLLRKSKYFPYDVEMSEAVMGDSESYKM